MSFAEYLRHGWKLCAIAPGTKGPRTKEWNTREHAIVDPVVGPSLAGAGLLHAWSETCALDVDSMDHAAAWLEERGVDLHAMLDAETAVRIDSGREGRAKLLYRLPTPLASLSLAPYEVVDPETKKPKTFHGFELRCATTDGLSVQDILPPSIHAVTGRPYRWVFGDDLVGHWSNLPLIPDELLAIWRQELAGAAPKNTAPQAPVGASFDEMRKLLTLRDPGCSYDDWIEVGAMLHHETKGSQDGLGLWNEWSAKGASYKGVDDLVSHWRSFRFDVNNPKTLGSLRREAVASLEEFPTVEADVSGKREPDHGVDTRPAAVIQRILEPRLVLVTGQSAYFDLQSNSGELLSDYVVRHTFCPQMPTIVTDTKKGPKVTKIDPIDYLKESRTKQVVSAVGLNPGSGRFFEEDGRRFVNRYTPVVVQPIEPKPYEKEAFDFLWSRLRDPVFASWLMKFYAHALAKPGVKITAAPLLFSAAQGTGKNTLAKLIPEKLFGSQWVRLMSGDVLHSNFNDTVGEAWWLYLEELRSGSTKVERQMIANRIKSWITDNVIEVHPKGRKPYDIRNRLQITATSNFDDALQIDNNDRRWAICELGDPLTEKEGTTLYAFLNSDRAPGVLHYIFRQVNLTGFNPTGRAPVTQDKKTMVRAGLGQWEESVIERMVAGVEPFNRDLFQVSDLHVQVMGGTSLTLNKLARMLRQAPFNCVGLPPSGGVRLMAWRNADLWKNMPQPAKVAHLETGARPDGYHWETGTPVALTEMGAMYEPDEKVASEVEIPDDCKDLF